MTFYIYFLRGDKFEIKASSVSEAFKKLYKDHPETQAWDVWKVTDADGNEV